MKNILIIKGDLGIHSQCWVDRLLEQQSENGTGVWGQYRFTGDKNAGKFDGVIVVNAMAQNQYVHCNPDGVFAVNTGDNTCNMHIKKSDGRKKNFTKYPVYKYILDPFTITKEHSRIVASPDLKPWNIDKNYTQLSRMQISPQKLYGYNALWDVNLSSGDSESYNRKLFYYHGKQYYPELFSFCGDTLGKNAVNSWDIMSQYKYNVITEHYKKGRYWSSGICDAFLAFNLPFYYGSDAIEEHFPEKSFIRINIKNEDEAIDIIQEAIESRQWEHRQRYIYAARALVLEKYHFLAYISDFLDENLQDSPAQEVCIPTYKKPTLAGTQNGMQKVLGFPKDRFLKRLCKKREKQAR